MEADNPLLFHDRFTKTGSSPELVTIQTHQIWVRIIAQMPTDKTELVAFRILYPSANDMLNCSELPAKLITP